MKNKEMKIGFKKILSNNIFALKIIHRIQPSYIPLFLLFSVIRTLVGFLSGTFLLRQAVLAVEGEIDVSDFFVFLVIIILVQFLTTLFEELWFYKRKLPCLDQKILSSVQMSIFKKSVEIDLESYDDPEFYDRYVKAMDEAYSRTMNVLSTVESVLCCLTELVANIILILAIDPYLVFWCVIPLIQFFLLYKQKKLRYSSDSEMRHINREKKYVERTFYLKDYAKELRLYNIWRLMFEKHKLDFNEYIINLKKYGTKIAVLEFLASSMSNFGVLGAMFYSVYCTIYKKTMVIADCVVIINSIGTVNQNISDMLSNIVSFYENALYIEDYRCFMDSKPQIDKRENGIIAHGGSIKIENLSFKYPQNNKPVLRNISIHIEPGEKIAIVGRNGSGKSTLIKLLLNLYEPDSGDILLNGVNINQYSLKSYQSLYSVVFQDSQAFSLSVAENILLRPCEKEDYDKLWEGLKKSGAYDKVKSFYRGLDTVMTREFDENGVVLSGGESQKINLARVFIESEKPFIILDEPTGALDPIAEYNMFNNMLRAGDKRTIIFISHRMSSVTLADRIYLIDAGEIIEQGSHKELLAKNGVYAKMFYTQSAGYAQEGND